MEKLFRSENYRLASTLFGCRPHSMALSITGHGHWLRDLQKPTETYRNLQKRKEETVRQWSPSTGLSVCGGVQCSTECCVWVCFSSLFLKSSKVWQASCSKHCQRPDCSNTYCAFELKLMEHHRTKNKKTANLLSLSLNYSNFFFVL